MQKTGEVDEYYDGESPAGSRRNGYTTYEEPVDSPLARGVRDFLVCKIRPEGRKYFENYIDENVVDAAVSGHPLLLTVHECWSGYSEYTITSVWQEIGIEWGTYSHHFESMPDFFRSIADAGVALERDEY